MKNTKLYFFFFFIAINLIGLSNSSAKELKMGYFVFSPHVFWSENGNLTGAAVDWFKQYIIPQLRDVSIIWDSEETPVPRLLKNLEHGVTDIAMVIAKHSNREDYLYYPKEPDFIMTPGLLVKKSFPLNHVQSLDEIKSIRLGYAIGGYLPQDVKEANLNFDLISGKDWMGRSIRKLMAGRLEAVYCPQDITLEYTIKEHGVRKQIKILPLPVESINSYTVFSKKTTDMDLVNQYERALEHANATMPYARFLAQWVAIEK